MGAAAILTDSPGGADIVIFARNVGSFNATSFERQSVQARFTALIATCFRNQISGVCCRFGPSSECEFHM
jgi:hypothetical protein